MPSSTNPTIDGARSARRGLLRRHVALRTSRGHPPELFKEVLEYRRPSGTSSRTFEYDRRLREQPWQTGGQGRTLRRVRLGRQGARQRTPRRDRRRARPGRAIRRGPRRRDRPERRQHVAPPPLTRPRRCPAHPAGRQAHLLPARQRARRRPVGGDARRRRRARRRDRGARRRATSGARRLEEVSRDELAHRLAPARSSSSMCAPPRSSRLATSRCPIGSHQRARRQPRALPRDARSSPTAAARTASTPTKPSQLRERGFKAGRLEDGYPEWQRDGLPSPRAAAEDRSTDPKEHP